MIPPRELSPSRQLFTCREVMCQSGQSEESIQLSEIVYWHRAELTAVPCTGLRAGRCGSKSGSAWRLKSAWTEKTQHVVLDISTYLYQPSFSTFIQPYWFI